MTTRRSTFSKGSLFCNQSTGLQNIPTHTQYRNVYCERKAHLRRIFENIRVRSLPQRAISAQAKTIKEIEHHRTRMDGVFSLRREFYTVLAFSWNPDVNYTSSLMNQYLHGDYIYNKSLQHPLQSHKQSINLPKRQTILIEQLWRATTNGWPNDVIRCLSLSLSPTNHGKLRHTSRWHELKAFGTLIALLVSTRFWVKKRHSHS